jgi:F-type H+-transporting ATPase subunit gamma
MASVVASVVSRVAIGPESPKLLAGTGSDQSHLLIVCTSDRGLAGGFNSNIVRAARRTAESLIAEGKTVYFYLVGRKGRAVIQRVYPKQIVHQHDTSAIKQVSFADAQEIAKDVIDRYLTDGIDVVHLFYARFRSALVQEPVGQQIIPVPPVAADEVKGGGASAAVEYEPDQDEILSALLPRNVAVQVFRAMLENAASEQGSRMTAMDNATRNAGDMINRLTIEYNRTRQAAITKELIEIISGAEAL